MTILIEEHIINGFPYWIFHLWLLLLLEKFIVDDFSYRTFYLWWFFNRIGNRLLLFFSIDVLSYKKSTWFMIFFIEKFNVDDFFYRKSHLWWLFLQKHPDLKIFIIEVIIVEDVFMMFTFVFSNPQFPFFKLWRSSCKFLHCFQGFIISSINP